MQFAYLNLSYYFIYESVINFNSHKDSNKMKQSAHLKMKGESLSKCERFLQAATG